MKSPLARNEKEKGGLKTIDNVRDKEKKLRAKRKKQTKKRKREKLERRREK